MLFILFWHVVSSLNVENVTNNKQLRQSDREDVNHAGDYPYVVALLEIFKDENNTDEIYGFCTGSIIKVQWILTAAHCLDKRNAEELFIWYGNFTQSPLVTKLFSKVLKSFKHPVYVSKSQSFDYDISLLCVSHMDLKSCGMLSSLDYTVMVGLPVVTVSGSRTNTPGDHTMKIEWSGDLEVTECDEVLKAMSKYFLCITPKLSHHQHVCYGDSGGPVLFDGEIIGISAFRLGSYETVGVFTPVSPFLGWIQAVIHLESLTELKYTNVSNYVSKAVNFSQ